MCQKFPSGWTQWLPVLRTCQDVAKLKLKKRKPRFVSNASDPHENPEANNKPGFFSLALALLSLRLRYLVKTKMLVCGMYRSENAAKKSIAELTAHGFERSQVKTLFRKNMKNQYSHHDFVHAQPANVLHGAFIGALIGLFIFGFIGFFVGYFTNSSMLLASLLSGGLAGIFLGAASGALAGIGIPNSVNHRYRFYLQEGGLLIAVDPTSKKQQDIASKILAEMGAQDIAELKSAQVRNLAKVY